MLFEEFDMEKALRIRGEEALEEGEAFGVVKQIRRKLEKGQPSEMIAEALELEEGYVLSMIHFINENHDLSDKRLAELFVQQNEYSAC